MWKAHKEVERDEKCVRHTNRLSEMKSVEGTQRDEGNKKCGRHTQRLRGMKSVEGTQRGLEE